MRLSKRLLFVLVPVLLLVGAATAYAAGALPFTDIAGHWAQDAIVRLSGQGIIQGHSDGTFGPDEFVTRAQVATFLDRVDTENGDCKACHNDTTLLTGKAAAWSKSLHATGEVFLEDGGNKSCAGCHSGGGFSAMVAAGQNPSQVTAGDPNPTPQDCRACHKIHTTYTGTDWALETTAPVAFYALAGTYNGGAGNLCANCHQPRRVFPAADATGMVTVTARFGPHHGPQSAMLLGIGGAGATVGTPMFHYTAVADTCVTCHMGEGATHTFAPSVETCKTCHADATNFDIGGTQTEVQTMLDELKAALVAKGLLNAEGGIVAGTYPEAQAAALWNWIYVNNEDKSKGVHNPAYTKALLQAGLDALAS
ncbi:MAG: S-layer homology domain-containing protein [Actinobacteria bacterium]|nr:S-layer homology domain-containing protein [Actinomycetota bacterium]